MPTVRGRAGVKAFFAKTPAAIEAKLLRGAARAGAAVIAGEAKDRVTSDQVRNAIVITTASEPGRVVAKVQVKGRWPTSLGTWLEYGTAPHFITVDAGQRGGMSVRRLNNKVADGSLVIGGQFVGASVQHPGARPHPFLRVSLDLKATEAFASAQSFINARVTPAGVTGPDEGDDA